MNDETKMSIAEREAENAGPQCAFQRLRLDMDDVRAAYIAGREAEPCEEQVEAATVERSRHQILFSIDGIRKCCSCGAVVGGAWGDSRVAFERHVTMMMLEAARKAVM